MDCFFFFFMKLKLDIHLSNAPSLTPYKGLEKNGKDACTLGVAG